MNLSELSYCLHNRQNRPLSAGMPLVGAVGEPILPGNCQDQNQKRKFVSLLLHRIAGSLFLPLVGLKPSTAKLLRNFISFYHQCLPRSDMRVSPRQTLLVKSRCPIFNALGMRITRGTPWSLWFSNVVRKTAFPRIFDLTNRVCVDEGWAVRPGSANSPPAAGPRPISLPSPARRER
jgi:hypothetical protein